ncbi:MAG TPA: IS66 family transposase [Pyrinomonadaceae bacterium]|nr:IS66 family transposase [Pyrinomonadaceae bacterium]
MLVDRDYIFTLYSMGAGAVFRYLQQIEQRVEDAEARAARSHGVQAALLAKELASTRRTLLKKSRQLLAERQLNHQLRRRIRELEREIERGTTAIERDSHNSSLPPSLDPPWKKVLRTRSLRQKTGMKAGGQPGHQGHTLRQVAEPDEAVTRAPEVCRACGKSLKRSQATGCVRRQVFDLKDGHMSVTEHRALLTCCRQCKTTTRAKFPAGVRAPVQYGQGVLVRAGYLHLYQLLPVNRTSEAMRDLFGCPVSWATIERASRLFSGKLVRCEQRIKAAVRDSSVIGVDETGLRVAGHNAWVHVARTERLTHFAYDERRGKAAMDDIGILPQFRGTLVRDGYLSYTRFERCRHSLCNAHLLRELVFVEETSPEQQAWTTPLSKLLLKIKEGTELARARGAVMLDRDKQRAWARRYDFLVKRAERLNPPAAECRGEPGVPQRRVARPTPGKTVARLRRRRDEVLRFMTDLSVPFDNNGSERDLRMVKLQQKTSGGFRTVDGARTFCRVRSYLSTARKQGHSLLRALERALAGEPLPFPAADNGSTT